MSSVDFSRDEPTSVFYSMNYVLHILFPWPPDVFTWPSHGIPRAAVHRPQSTAVQLMANPAGNSILKVIRHLYKTHRNKRVME
jgi:hypothetical protein